MRDPRFNVLREARSNPPLACPAIPYWGTIRSMFRLTLSDAGIALAVVRVGAADVQAADAPKPKICLALSGGGARGVAHVGVLKVLEELRVPVHCIAGTSMGAVVGGAYATGVLDPRGARPGARPGLGPARPGARSCIHTLATGHQIRD